ncbi:MAG: choice-of-anchor Q domain-containing protein [Marinicella pacifica]
MTNLFNSKSTQLFISLIFITLFYGQSQAAIICYVSSESGGDGSSWSQPMSLHDALDDSACGEIWVKQGTYYPSDVGDRSVSFLINRNVEVYGGFEGDESFLAERSPGRYPSILSGNIGSLSLEDDNSYHVIYVDGTGANGPITRDTIIDGFTVTAGYADGQANPRNDEGGGLLCNGKGAGNECSPTISNMTFIHNYAFMGGAMMNYGYGQGTSSPLIVASTFAFNSSNNNGGAIYNHAFSGTNQTEINNVTFYGNTGFIGGAIYGHGYSGDNSPIILHSSFIKNNALHTGGAIQHFASEMSPSEATIINSIFWENSQSADGAILVMNATATINSSVFSDSCPDNVTCQNLMSGDPLLKPLMLDYGFTPTMIPRMSGAAYNAADDNYCTYLDQRGEVRPASGCDIGAVEINVLDSDVIYKHGFQLY